eukprot:TRINITY_DN1760_c0_g1_i2.p1 TRINITY_DN1760_c0_g1~~TRINITY_DN1760_c0_g1_i2.p1  ORF type:complete len:755 (-),score=237.44 TRINITY_DN1760_c0_g1_i2:41-2305(-)
MTTVEYSSSAVPVAAILAAAITQAKDVKFVAKEGAKTSIVGGASGSVQVAEHFARSNPAAGLYGTQGDADQAHVNKWMAFFGDNGNNDAVARTNIINAHLQLRTVLVGHSITLADLVALESLKYGSQQGGWDAILAATQGGKTIPHVVRLFSYIESLPLAQAALKDKIEDKKGKGKASLDELWDRKLDTGAQGSFDKIELPGAEVGKVVTRFPPEPSGFLHIGHAKAALLNNYYARAYKGKMILRFDDTNPRKENDEFVQNILKDLETLEIKPDQITYTSDYFEQLTKYCEQLLREGNGYVDKTPVLEMREERDKGIESKYRSQSVDENLRLFEEMKKGSDEGQLCVVRAKMDMQALNKVLRDPAMFRCVSVPHHRTGSTYKAYPLYDFAVPIVDSLEGITHALRSSEYHDRNPLYNWVVDILKLRRPIINDFSRVNFSFVLLSKRKLAFFVEQGLVDGWDDPRFPTVQGIVRRGLTVGALREFILSQGASKALNLMDMDKLWALNKKVIDPAVPRYTAISSEGAVPLLLTNFGDEPTFKTVPRHKDNPAIGKKSLTFSKSIVLEGEDARGLQVNEEVTLQDWGNAIIRKVTKDGEGRVTALEGELHLAGDPKDKNTKKLSWISAGRDEEIPIIIREYDFLITKKKLEEADKFEDFINKDSLWESRSIGEAAIRLLNKGDQLQLMRRGYFICDRAYGGSPDQPMILVQTPDGKARQHSTLSAHVSIAYREAEREKEVKAAKAAAASAAKAATKQ